MMVTESANSGSRRRPAKPDANVSNELAEPLVRPDVADMFLGLLQSSELDPDDGAARRARSCRCAT